MLENIEQARSAQHSPARRAQEAFAGQGRADRRGGGGNRPGRLRHAKRSCQACSRRAEKRLVKPGPGEISVGSASERAAVCPVFLAGDPTSVALRIVAPPCPPATAAGAASNL